jgi:hypothetical protein
VANQPKRVDLQSGKAGGPPLPRPAQPPAARRDRIEAPETESTAGASGAAKRTVAVAGPVGEAAREAERLRRQRARSIGIALALAALVALFYLATLVRLGGNVLNRAI